MKPTVSMRKALSDKQLLGNALAGDSRKVWRMLLIAANGEKLTADERVLFKQRTGREHEPRQRVRTFVAVGGRRGGKTQALAAHGTYLAALCDHSDALARGETGVLLCLAQDTQVAAKLLEYIEANLTGSPILRQMITGRTQDSIELTNSISIEVRPASFRKLRGPTYIGVICDELAYWFTELQYVNPDVEIVAAVKPGLLTTGGPLLMASSAYSKRGVLWDMYRQHYGMEGDPLTLVAHGTTRDFNPTIPQSEIDRELAKDRARNRAEYLSEFRSDIEGFVALEIVEACVGDYVEQLAAPNTTYRAFVDPSGGSEDSFTLAISHRDYRSDLVVIDCVRERRPPFSPEAVVAEFAVLCKSYRVSRVTGDRYGGELPRELFRKHGISYDLAKQTKSELFRDLLPLLNSAKITLPRSDRLISQIVSLERRVAPGGRETISHPERGHGHDDLANAAAGAAKLSGPGGYNHSMDWIDGPETPPPDPKATEERVRKLTAAIMATGRVPDEW